MQDIREKHQAFGVTRNALIDVVCAVIKCAAENNFENEDAQDRPGVEFGDRPRERGDKSEGEENCGEVPVDTRQLAFTFGPDDERLGIQARAEFFAHDREVALQIELVAKFADESLAFENFGALGW